ncbi:MAG: type IVB secretion system protein IcmH/DotU [Sulfurovum sp.]|nr:type IVB secretion system protein IcmH/DotU [Sulfurovum sp.]
MSEDDKTVLIHIGDSSNPTLHTVTESLSPAPSDFRKEALQAYRNTSIPFMYSKQNQPFLRTLRTLYFEIYLIERGDSSLNSTRLREKIIDIMDNHMKSLAELGYENTHIMIIRYILATFIDELLGAVQWKGADGWLNQYSILGYYYKETYGGEKFFQLLNQFVQEPSQYMQHMKLIYVCLSLGYKGKYALLQNDNGQVEKVRQELYAHIKNYNIEEEKFYKDHPVSTKKHKLTFDVSYKLFLLGSLLMLGIIYSIFTNMVKNNEDHLIGILNEPPLEKTEKKEVRKKEVEKKPENKVMKVDIDENPYGI